MTYRIEGDVDGVDVAIPESTPHDGIRIISRGRGNAVRIGRNCRISGHVFLANGATLIIGDDVKSTGPLTFHLHEGSTVMIGDGCLFSQSVIFRPSDAHKIIDINTGERLNPPMPIKIGKGVWMGEQVLVLKGAEVGDGSVVGARSTLTSALHEENVLIAGTPARILRTGVRWEP